MGTLSQSLFIPLIGRLILFIGAMVATSVINLITG